MAGICSECGGFLTGQADEAICPACLLGGMDEAPPAEDLAAVFPDLTIERLLGRGGMGCVYEASQSPLNRKVAVKILPLEGRPDRVEVEERFLREGQALARLDHPNIVRVHQSGEAGGWLYLVMEFISGEDLAKRLAAGPLPWRQAVELAEQLCAGLAAAHALAIVHRDIKPGNLLLTEDGRLKIADFGLAKVARGPDSAWTLTKADSTMGTPFYMAPEQRRPGQPVEARADLYSTGVVLYEMLTGQLPMGHYRKASQVAGSPPALDGVLEKALATDPAERWDSAEELGEALRLVRLREGRPRKNHGLKVAAVAAAALIGAGAFWLSRKPDSPSSGILSGPPVPPAAESQPVRWSIADGIRLTAPEPGGLFGTMAVSEQDLLVVARPGQDHFGEVSSCEGAVLVYPLDAMGRPGAPVRLQADHPQEGDLFGFVVDVDPEARLIAVTTPFARPPGAAEDDDRRGAVDLFHRQPGPELRFVRGQTLWLDRAFTESKVQIRAFAGKGILAVCSPGLEPAGAVRIYREQAGTWIPETTLQSGQVRGAANFGWFADPDEEGRLLVSAYRHMEGSMMLHGGVVPFVRKPDRTWEERPLLRDPEGNALALSGMAMVRSADRLLIAAPGDRRDGVLGAGSIGVYQRGAAGADWEFLRQLVMPENPVTQAGFGQRLAAFGDMAAVSVVRGGLKKDGRNAVLFLRDYWKEKPAFAAMIEARAGGELWLGRLAYTDRLFVICHPRESSPGGAVNSGSVYVFPRGDFPVLFGGR